MARLRRSLVLGSSKRGSDYRGTFTFGKYTLCLIKQGTKILLLNREFPTWMGCWNGIGGKIEKEEQPRLSMLRENCEETTIESPEIIFKGLITWSTVEGTDFGGLYLYIAEISEDYIYQTPIRTDEGILDWKEINWIFHPENLGVASNIPSCLNSVLNDNNCFDHHSIFSGDKMIDQVSSLIDPRIENNEVMRNEYLSKYTEEGSGIRRQNIYASGQLCRPLVRKKRVKTISQRGILATKMRNQRTTLHSQPRQGRSSRP